MYSIEEFAPLPDEHLASVVARFHRRNGTWTIQTTLNELFGNPKEAPRRKGLSLRNFFANLGVVDIEEQVAFLDRTTVFPLKRIWRTFNGDEVRARQLLPVSKNPLTKDLEYEFRVRRAHRAFRHCPDCVRDDLSHHGVAYWHRIHQVNGVSVCPRHQSLLYREAPAEVKVGCQPSSTWRLPSDIAFEPAKTIPVVDPATFRRLADVAYNYASICQLLLGFPRDYAFDVNAQSAIRGAIAHTTGAATEALEHVRLFNALDSYLKTLRVLGHEPDQFSVQWALTDWVRLWVDGWAGAIAFVSFLFETPERLQAALSDTYKKPVELFPDLGWLFAPATL